MANVLRSLTGRGKDVISQNQYTNDIDESLTSNHDDSKSQEIDANLEQKVQNWSIPKFKTNQVYKTSIFEIKPNYKIHTIEKCFGVQGPYKSSAILDSDIVNQHMRNYSYLHFGLVQVAVKALIRLRSEFPILVCLRDKRFKNFHDSVIQVLECNIQSGPAYFNCFPNYQIALTCPWATKCFVLDIKIPSEKLIEGTPAVSVMYKLCYKVSNKAYDDTKALKQSRMNETVVIEVNGQNPSITTQKRLIHDQVTFPEEWLQERSSPPEPQTQRKINKRVQTSSGVTHTSSLEEFRPYWCSLFVKRK